MGKALVLGLLGLWGGLVPVFYAGGLSPVGLEVAGFE